MDIFKKFSPEELQIHQTRIYLDGISFSDANKAARQFDWVQFHITKRDDGKVNVSFIADRNKTLELYNFLKGDGPVHA